MDDEPGEEGDRNDVQGNPRSATKVCGSEYYKRE